ncbi:hypothetical protein [Novipirellula caenicola]|uniref:Tetratricopeptide repeat protein n=1 Tax=Novipirellula caenicola TaxID=1536901 RepID=A0ABP9W155_9BACT
MLQYFSPLHWLRWTGQFVYAWAISTPWHDAAKGIPAFLLMISLAVLGVVASSDGSTWRSDRVDQQFAKAWEADDFTTAELVIHRQLRERSDHPPLLYRLALTRDALDHRDEATELMRSLVIHRQHPPAARWLLTHLYAEGKWTQLESDQQAELGRILALLHQESPNDLGVKQLYADYFIATQRPAQAIPLLEQLAEVHPMQGLRAAAIARQANRETQAERLALRSLETVSKRWNEEPKNLGLALAVAQNQIFLRRHSDAVLTLQKAVSRVDKPEDSQVLQMAMGDTLLAWIAEIEQAPEGTEKRQLQTLQLLQQALQVAPNSPRVLSVVVDRVLGLVDEQDAEISAVRDALIEGTSPGIAHFIQGTTAMIKDDTEKATMHLTIAAELMPNSAAILNNLAVAMSVREEADLEQALKLSQTAIKQVSLPSPHFYDTRGQILTKLQRYHEAIPDLERALSVPELSTNAHQSLAVCYEAIGEPELAAEHREAGGGGEGEVRSEE